MGVQSQYISYHCRYVRDSGPWNEPLEGKVERVKYVSCNYQIQIENVLLAQEIKVIYAQNCAHGYYSEQPIHFFTLKSVSH